MAKTNRHRARQTPEAVYRLPAGHAKLAVLNTRTRPMGRKIYRPARMDAVATKAVGFPLFLYRLLRDQCELAQVVIIERALSVGGLIKSECSGDFDFERTGVDKAVDLV